MLFSFVSSTIKIKDTRAICLKAYAIPQCVLSASRPVLISDTTAPAPRAHRGLLKWPLSINARGPPWPPHGAAAEARGGQTGAAFTWLCPELRLYLSRLGLIVAISLGLQQKRGAGPGKDLPFWLPPPHPDLSLRFTVKDACPPRTSAPRCFICSTQCSVPRPRAVPGTQQVLNKYLSGE